MEFERLIMLYIVGNSSSFRTNLWKLGVHTGTLDTLRSRYITAIPDLVVGPTFYHKSAKSIELFMKRAFVQFRQQNESGNLSEYFAIPLDSLTLILQGLMTLADTDENLLKLKKIPLTKKKRKADKNDNSTPNESKRRKTKADRASPTAIRSMQFDKKRIIERQDISTKNETHSSRNQERQQNCQDDPKKIDQEAMQKLMSTIRTMKPDLAVDPRYRDVVTEILWLVMTKKDFEITLDDFRSLLSKHGIKKQKSHLKRQLLLLKEGTDFVEFRSTASRSGVAGGPIPQVQKLTINAFKMICLRTKTPIRNYLTEYFLFVDEVVRNDVLERIQTHRVFQGPSTTENRTETFACTKL